nr:alpha-amylase family glycosyl hydrolase [Kofleriaceae bacterium]
MGCPQTSDPSLNGSGDGSGSGSDVGSGSGSSAIPACANPIPTCTTTLTYRGSAASVTLMGDFAADGWTTGAPMTNDGTGTWTVTIPANDEQVILYKFDVDGTWQADPENTRRSPDGFGGFNSVIRVDCDHCAHAAPMDWRDGIIYFVVLDRFANGDTSNDAPVPGAEMPGQYQGGDFAGLKAKLDAGYFNDLGINTLWITSPLSNTHTAYPGADGHTYSGYHGYWPDDETTIDSHYGSEDDLKALVLDAHQHGIQVLLDYVMNHMTTDASVYEQNNDWFWPNDNGAGGNCICGQGCAFNTQCWFDTFLPTFNMTDPDARHFSVSNAVQWAKDIGFDGFRLDAVKQVDISWFYEMRARAQAELAWDQRFYMVGETFDGNRDLIKSYVNPDTLLDGQFDFPMRAQILSTVLHRDGQFSDLQGFLDSNDGYYGAGAVMSTFLGNHDVPRSIEHALDTPMYDPWDGGKENNWSNQPQLPTSSSPFQRLAVAYTLLFTIPGIPMVYYGDEYGMNGAGDPDNRHFMQWDGYTADQTTLRDAVAGLAKMRAAHPATRRGTRTTLGVATDQYTYRMDTAGDTVFVALNRGDNSAQPPGLPSGTYVDLVHGGTVQTPISMPARSALVLGAM